MVDAGLAAGRRFRPSAEGKEAGVRGGAPGFRVAATGVTGADGTSVHEARDGSWALSSGSGDRASGRRRLSTYAGLVAGQRPHDEACGRPRSMKMLERSRWGGSIHRPRLTPAGAV